MDSWKAGFVKGILQGILFTVLPLKLLVKKHCSKIFFSYLRNIFMRNHNCDCHSCKFNKKFVFISFLSFGLVTKFIYLFCCL